MTRLMSLLILLLLLSTHPLVQASQIDPNFQSFWTKFKAAVAKNDKEAVASMTKLPFLFESKERDRAGFIRIYDQLFDIRVKKCFPSAKVLKEGDLYEVFCAKKIFYFELVNGEYRFKEFAVDY